MTRFTRDLDIFLGLCALFLLGYVVGAGLLYNLVRLVAWLGSR